MAAKWIELVTGSLEDKKRYREATARMNALPSAYRTAAEGVSRYLMYAGGGAEDRLVTMLEDLAELFEQSAAAGTPVREVVGEDPVEFVDEFKRNYGVGGWLTKEQRRLKDAIAKAEAEQ